MDRDLHDRLRWLEDELMEDPEESLDLEDIMAEFSEEEPRRPRTNRAAEYHRTAFADEKLDKSAAVTVPRKKGKKEKPAKNTSTRGLAVLALLEVIAIIGVLLWWLGWFL